MTSLTDSRGNTTQYAYNESRGYLDSVTTPDNTVTTYSYNGGELLSKVSVGGSNPIASVNYNYDSGKRLSSIVSPGYTTYGFSYDNFDRNTAVTIGNRTVSQYYYDSNFRLGSVVYGNGTTIAYGYDDLDRQTQVKINDTLRYEYQYDGTSRISQILDVQAGRKILYEYDLLDRVTQEKLYDTSGKNVLANLQIRYDDSKNRISGYDVNIQGTVKSTDYVYSTNSATPDLVSGVKLNGSQKLSYSYDSLNRLIARRPSTSMSYVTTYSYVLGDSTDKTTGLIKNIRNGSEMLSYTYDSMGNISSVSKNGNLIERYVYSSIGTLSTVDTGTDIYKYTYDTGGNLRRETKNGAITKTYEYGDSEWKDLLTSFNGQAITYDTIGNPLTYLGMNMTWSDGRNLATISSDTDSISYTYDVDNLRTSKTVNGVKTEYYWLDGKLMAQKRSNEYLLFQYDENGKAYGFILKNGTYEATYYYEFNVQGDIIGIINGGGTRVAEYSYNAWGKLISATSNVEQGIVEKNPLRYRGYYYDAETGFYYLNSRYYDPEVGRFLNADKVVSGVGGKILGYNVYVYCNNNPIVFVDSVGMRAVTALSNVNGPLSNTGSKDFGVVRKIANDIKKMDKNNTSERKVLESNYISAYKGKVTLRTNGERSGSFGVLLITRDTNTWSNAEDVVRHEYGHTEQLRQLGIVKYTLCIGVPSLFMWGTGAYYDKPWEVTADVYGGVKSRNPKDATIVAGFEYLENSKIWGPLIWLTIE